jgi:hypothetical protein
VSVHDILNKTPAENVSARTSSIADLTSKQAVKRSWDFMGHPKFETRCGSTGLRASRPSFAKTLYERRGGITNLAGV